MSAPKNIQIFNQIVATCMLRLYESFPVPTAIDPSDIALEAIKEDLPNTTLILHLLAQASAAVEFLAQEGLIRYKDRVETPNLAQFSGVQLTMKGLAILNAVPEAIDERVEQRSLAERMREAVKGGAMDAITNSVSSAFSAALGAGWHAMS